MLRRTNAGAPMARLMTLVLVLASLPTASVGAGEATVSAQAAWKGDGRLYRTGKDQALFFGALQGVLFVDSGPADLKAARLVCPTMVDVNVISGQQTAEGRCIITTASGDRLLGRWTCFGVHLTGCRGRFTLTGGTGKFQDVKGDGDFIVRSALAGITVAATEDTAVESAVGLASWPQLRYRISSARP